MSKELRELAPPRMFPRTEAQAKATVFFVLFVVLAGLAYAVAHGLNLSGG